VHGTPGLMILELPNERGNQQIDIGFANELLSVDPEAGEQSLSDIFPFALRLLRPKHDLQFQEISQILDPIEVYASLADQI
jgi:hypothetical protein